MFGVLFALVLAVGACGSPDDAAERDHERRVRATRDPGPSDRFDNEGLIVRSFDLSNDDVADLWKIFSLKRENVDDVEPTLKLVRKEVDSNFDNVVDIWFHYNSQEKLYREEADTDFDGNFDMVSYYEKGRLMKRDLHKVGIEFPVAIRHFREGRLYKVEFDEDGNGAVERWEIYVEGRLTQVGHDVDGDGKVDYWNSFE